MSKNGPPPPGPPPSPDVQVGWQSPSAKSRARVVWRFLITRGLGPVEAAAFVGNFLVETGWSLSPKAKNPDGYRGIAMWSPSERSGRRWQKLEIFAKQNKQNKYSIWTQLRFVAAELSDYIPDDSYAHVLDLLGPFRSINDPVEATGKVDSATEIVTRHYEQAVNGDGSLQAESWREYEAHFALHEFWSLR